MIFNRGYLERSLTERLAACSFDELRVLDRVLAGIEQGRDEYGPLDLTRDVRNWLREGRSELRDLLFYLAAHEVAADHHEREQRHEAFHREVSERLDELRAYAPARSAPTEELSRCMCGHPQTLHANAAYECLIGDCSCAEYEGTP